MRTGIVILNYNGYADTLACLKSLQHLSATDCAIVLIDNGSTNDSVAKIRSWSEDNSFFDHEIAVSGDTTIAARELEAVVRGNEHRLLVRSAQNTGFARGNNLGALVAQQLGCDTVLLLNNDTVVEPDFLDRLQHFYRKHLGSVLTPQIRLFEPSDKIWNCGGELQSFGRKRYHLAGRPVSEVPDRPSDKISFITGCALFFDPKVTGVLTERFFFGEEDMEFSIRLHRRATPVYCVYDSVIYHKVGSTLNTNYRKSEIFVLKRLINIRTHFGRGYFLTTCLVQGAQLFRLLTRKYGLPVAKSLQIVRRTVGLAGSLPGVGPRLSVHYVLGHEDHATALRGDRPFFATLEATTTGS